MELQAASAAALVESPISLETNKNELSLRDILGAKLFLREKCGVALSLTTRAKKNGCSTTRSRTPRVDHLVDAGDLFSGFVMPDGNRYV